MLDAFILRKKRMEVGQFDKDFNSVATEIMLN